MLTKRIAVLASAAALSLTLAACASDSAGGDSSSSPEPTVAAAEYPITIDHALGTTTIQAKPERVATVAWANQEAPIALGVVPVGMSKITWGDDNKDGVMPWVSEALTALGAQTPVLFDESDGINFEEVADTNPDLILAPYSGLTKEQYETLSKIAPTVAFPDIAWGTSWEDMIAMSAKALGVSAQGDALVSDINAQVKASLAKYPELQNKKVLFTYIDPKDLSQIGFYAGHDTRPSFLTGLGLPAPSIVAALPADSEGYITVSSEEADKFKDVDVIVSVGDPKGDFIKRLQADPLLSKIPAIKNGNIAILPDSTPLAAAANPSPLSLGWAIDDYFALLANAAKAKN